MSAFDDAIQNPSKSKRASQHTANVLHDNPVTSISNSLSSLENYYINLKRAKNSTNDIEAENNMRQIDILCKRVANELDEQLKINQNDRTLIRLNADYNAFKQKYEILCKSSQSNSFVVDIPEEKQRESESGPKSFVVQSGKKILKFKTLGSTAVDEAIVDERTEAAQDILTRSGELNALFVDVNKLVEKQGEDIKAIQDNTQRTGEATQEGLKQLVQAEKYQKSSGKTFMYLAIFLIVVIYPHH